VEAEVTTGDITGVRMNRTFKAAAAALIVAVSFAGSITAGPLEDASAAVKEGDYETGGAKHAHIGNRLTC
jgi:hypothetical protein